MKVGVVGAGSIGLLFAAYLSRRFNVTVYTRTEEQASEINKFGILLKNSGRTISFVTALPFSEWQGMEDLSIITVKQYQLDDIIGHILQMPAEPENLLFLQNGMGHLEKLQSLAVPNLFVGTIEHGALRENSYTVSHNGFGVTNIAVFRGESNQLFRFISSAPEEFPFVFKERYEDMLLNKLIANAVINPLSAILKVENGDLIENPYYFKVLDSLFTEIAAVLELENAQSDLERVINICRTTAENRSSMLKDLEANRLTEIDAILGYILAKANKQDRKVPLLESLYYIIKGKENGGREVVK